MKLAILCLLASELTAAVLIACRRNRVRNFAVPAAIREGGAYAVLENRIGTISRAIQMALDSHALVPSRDYLGCQIGKQAVMSPAIPCFHEGGEAKSATMQPGQLE